MKVLPLSIQNFLSSRFIGITYSSIIFLFGIITAVAYAFKAPLVKYNIKKAVS